MRKFIALMLAVTLGALTACSDNEASDPRKEPGGDQVKEAAFAAPVSDGAQPTAVTYDAALVPISSRIVVGSRESANQSTVTLSIAGLLPNRDYGAHVHVKPCGLIPAASGPHYQNEKDSVSPSVDPKFANPQNEIWLDFTTDAAGKGKATASVQWKFRPAEANSLVLHKQRTATHPGHAGTAGDRVACMTRKF